MASLATHFSAFLLLFPVGLRRLHSSSSLYLKNPSVYRSKTWYFSEPRWKNLDFYSLIIALPIASFSEIFIFLTFSGHPTYRFSFFQQSVTLFLFWALIILVILREYTGPLLINEAFFAEFLLSSGLVFKGTWVLQTGLSLYTDVFGLKGCKKMSLLSAQGNADLQCDLQEDRLRGVALMNLLFTGHAILVLAVSIVLFGLLSSNRALRCGEASGPLLMELESETMSMRAHPELEMD
ncbi:hypothetical protein I3760_02G108100 [Carya illinoinensis]|nr:hypothetical protein I3760_02G108100 [Carya illinoinensis]